MAYTVGVKRKLFFGYRKVMVNAHDWQNGRFILNLTDGSQRHIPGFSVPELKVYADFWTHLAQTRPQVASPKIQASAPVATYQPPAQEELNYSPAPPAREPTEVEKRAAERVRSIFAGDGASARLEN